MLMSCLCQPVHAGLEGFIDRDDGHLDVSEWLVDRKGFLAMPIVVTEPAVGYGAGVALMFVRNSMRESAASDKGSGSACHPTSGSSARPPPKTAPGPPSAAA